LVFWDGAFACVLLSGKGIIMKNRILLTAAIVGAFCAPLAVHAQGVTGGIEQGAHDGDRAAGPVGGVVGGVVGGIGGGVAGLLGIDQRPRFREYVVNEHRPSYRYTQDLRVGSELPVDGVQYYDVPHEYGQTQYRYTIVNDEPVLVDPQTHRVMQIIQ